MPASQPASHAHVQAQQPPLRLWSLTAQQEWRFSALH